MAIWDDYLNNPYSGNPLAMALSAAQGQPNRRTVTTSGTPKPSPEPQPAPTSTPQSNFPAANPTPRPDFSTNAPVNTPQQYLSQVPVGGFGTGFGYQGSQPAIGNFLNQGGQQQDPTLSGYHWMAGTGGVSGGNNATANYYWNNGTTTRGPASSQYNLPILGAPQSAQPSIGYFPATQYTQPGVNADVRALSDPSVGALDNARRSMNQYGQNVVNPAGGGQMISGKGPNFGSLYGSTQSVNQKGQQVLNTPSGGQAIGGPSTRKPPMFGAAQNSQTWQWGGWY